MLGVLSGRSCGGAAGICELPGRWCWWAAEPPATAAPNTAEWSVVAAAAAAALPAGTRAEGRDQELLWRAEEMPGSAHRRQQVLWRLLVVPVPRPHVPVPTIDTLPV